MSRERPRIEPSLSGPADSASAMPSPTRRSAPPQAKRQRASSGKWIAACALLAVGLIGGWHYLCSMELQDQLRVSLGKIAATLPLPARVEVNAHPISNVVRVRLVVKGVSQEDVSTPSIFRMVNEIHLSLLNTSEAIEKRLDRDLPVYARESFDVFALIFPYRADVAVEGGGSQSSNQTSQRDHQAPADDAPTALLTKWGEANNYLSRWSPWQLVRKARATGPPTRIEGVVLR